MSTINAIHGQTQNAVTSSGSAEKSGKSFKETLSTYVNDVNGLIQDANSMVEKMASGDIEDVHQVMIAMEKASIGLELAVEVRNKLLESYREFMRMQV